MFWATMTSSKARNLPFSPIAANELFAARLHIDANALKVLFE
jgi:hypothetical protein